MAALVGHIQLVKFSYVGTNAMNYKFPHVAF